jgi:hypothetical protein
MGFNNAASPEKRIEKLNGIILITYDRLPLIASVSYIRVFRMGMFYVVSSKACS